jgi:hypothetical protein
MQQINNKNHTKFIHSFISSYMLHTNIIYLKHVWHIDKYVNRWNMNLWINKCHINFAFLNKYVCQMCFQCVILVHEMYKIMN